MDSCLSFSEFEINLPYHPNLKKLFFLQIFIKKFKQEETFDNS